MPAAFLAWLIGHQALAALAATYLGAAAAGISVTDEAVKLYQDVKNVHVEQPVAPKGDAVPKQSEH